jgi:DNA primase
VCYVRIKLVLFKLFSPMQIPEIRSRLPLSKVLAHYNWKPDSRGRMRCPFHDDKSPSLQTYPETGTVYCFAGGCPTHGRSLDVIDIIKEKEGCTKHEAILKAKQLAGDEPKPVQKPIAAINRTLADEAARAAVLSKVWTTMKSGLALSTVAKGYLEKRGLDYKVLDKAGAGVGYNSGQMHYGHRKDHALIESCLKYGLLSDSGKKSRTGEPAYTTFAKGAVVFALKTQGGKIGGLYFRSVNDQGGRHFYLRDRKGLWPRWPEVKTKRVLLCESIIDAASVLKDERVQKAWSVLALYGTNGWTAEHTEAINRLDELEEICLLLDGDAAGKRATDTYAKKVRELWPTVQVTSVELPVDEDVNGVLVKSGVEVLAQAITDRCEVIFTSTDPSTPASFRMTEAETPPSVEEQKSEEIPVNRALDESNPYDLGYGGRAAKYRIKGYRVGQLDSLKVTLQIQAG